MPRCGKQLAALFCAAVCAASDGSCDCEAVCMDLVRDGLEEIARLQAQVRALQHRVSQSTVAVPGARRAANAGDACSEESLELKSDEEMEALRGCHNAGSLKIHGDKVTSLAGLQSLETASGIAIIGAGDAEQDKLSSLVGLESLRSVGSSLVIWGNDNLLSLGGLESLQTAGRINVTSNGKLMSMAGPENLVSVEHDFTVEGNGGLETLVGLENLTRVGGALVIQQNDNLLSFSGLTGLQTAGQIVMRSNKKVRSMAGLENLVSVEGDFIIGNNARLQTLFGLENLMSVGGLLHMHTNGKLISPFPLQHLQAVGNLWVWKNHRLETLAGLENIARVENLRVSGDELLSLSGLEGLHSANYVWIHSNAKLESLRGLGNLTTVDDEIYVNENGNSLRSLSGLESLQTTPRLRVADNHGLESLAGLESLTVVEDLLLVRLNDKLLSLSGLQSLQTAGQVTVEGNKELLSLHGLGNLTRVKGALRISNNYDLQTLEGLERLRSVGFLEITSTQPYLRSFFPGLQSLEYAYRGITMMTCVLESLHGLGSLISAAQLEMLKQSGCLALETPMKFLGAPFGAGASLLSVVIDPSVWPQCITAHEHMALVSAVSANVTGSLLPEQKCQTRNLVGPFTCTRGLPCKFSVSNFSFLPGEEQPIVQSVFVSGVSTGCGSCPQNHLQSQVEIDGTVNFGYALRSEEAGLRSVCLCKESGAGGPVGELFLRGPKVRRAPVTCTRGHECVVKLEGEALERTDRVVLRSSSCSQEDPTGFAASWSAQNEYLLHGPSGWYSAPPIRYQVCWRAPCSFGADGPACPAPENTYYLAGEVEVFGPYPNNYAVDSGENLSAVNIGLGVLDGDHMRLLRACGKVNEGEMDSLEAISRSGLFLFGALTADRVGAGRHHLCWCQEHQGENGVVCKDEGDFMADSGIVLIRCLAGQEFDESSGCCKACPAGRHQLDRGLDSCSECLAGRFSSEGASECTVCRDGTIAETAGSSACASCLGWQNANEGATECSPNPPMLLLLTSFLFSVGALCWWLVRNIRKLLSVVDVSLNQDSTLVTTFGPHGLSNFGRSSFPVKFSNTGHPGLDGPSQPLRARVRDAARLELLSSEQGPITSRLDTSMGKLVVAFPYNFYHQGWPLPLVICLPGLLIITVTLGIVAATADMATEGFLGAAVAALVSSAAASVRRLRPRATPLTQRLSEFDMVLAQGPGPISCNKGPERAIPIGRLHELLEFFHQFIRDRDAYYVTSNLLIPLTNAEKLSYAELIGPRQVQWFVSHFWGTAFEHFCMSLKKHAEAISGEGEWTQVCYWVCFCSNNQHKIEEELGSGWAESSFYVTLKSGHCQGTCMVLDDRALPLTRIWCIFELLQTVKLQRSGGNFQGLLFCTSGGVLNTGGGNVEVAMALAKKVADMNLETAQATSENDAKMIRAQVIQEMGSFAALNRFACQEVHGMLAHAQSNANRRFAEVLAHLEENIVEDSVAAV